MTIKCMFIEKVNCGHTQSPPQTAKINLLNVYIMCLTSIKITTVFNLRENRIY